MESVFCNTLHNVTHYTWTMQHVTFNIVIYVTVII